jgi:hypothetical protein
LEITGIGFTVTVLVAVTLGQPAVVFVTVYVIKDDPTVKDVIAPVVGSIVATAGVPDVHVPPLTVEVKVVVLPIQIF